MPLDNKSSYSFFFFSFGIGWCIAVHINNREYFLPLDFLCHPLGRQECGSTHLCRRSIEYLIMIIMIVAKYGKGKTTNKRKEKGAKEEEKEV